jgi:hypothetical protein
VATFRKELFTDQKIDLMLTMGEDTMEFQRLMESLLDEFDPRPGIELQIVEQIAQTFWRMRRAQRMQDGMAAKRIRARIDMERMAVATQADRTYAALIPFQHLRDALARRVVGPTVKEIDAFVESRSADASPEMLAFIHLLRSLRKPMEAQERRATLRKARLNFRHLIQAYENVAYSFQHQVDLVDSPENLAAIMAPDDKRAALAQRMEDSCLDRIGKLISALQKVRAGALRKKEDAENEEQSRNVYENKQNIDKMTPESSDI